MILAGVLFITGLFLSALFSGTETGFYRANRIRLAMDLIEGDRISRYLLLMGNQPGLFVASTLIGNNIANYLTSLAIVMFARNLFTDEMTLVELVVPILFAPFLFVYGELLPKQLYYRAPNRMLRLGAPVFLIFSILFLPVSLILWALSRLLQVVVRHSPEQMRASVARKEIKRILLEGKEAGILDTYQQNLTEQFFAVANRPIIEACKPIEYWPVVSFDANVDEIRDAMILKDKSVAILNDKSQSDWAYVTSPVLLKWSSENDPPPVIPVPAVPESMPQAQAILLMQSSESRIVRVENDKNHTIGFVSFDELTESIFVSAAEKDK
jgi:putative hemolysin